MVKIVYIVCIVSSFVLSSCVLKRSSDIIKRDYIVLGRFDHMFRNSILFLISDIENHHYLVLSDSACITIDSIGRKEVNIDDTISVTLYPVKKPDRSMFWRNYPSLQQYTPNHSIGSGSIENGDFSIIMSIVSHDTIVGKYYSSLDICGRFVYKR